MMSTIGFLLGYIMIIGGVLLCLNGVDSKDGGFAIAGAILIATAWFGCFVMQKPTSE